MSQLAHPATANPHDSAHFMLASRSHYTFTEVAFMKVFAHATLILASTLALAGVGCGGSSATIDLTDTDGGEDGGTGNDGGGSSDGAVNPACPASAPTGGTTCATSATCEYGTDPNINCNVLARCTQGAWQVTSGQGPTCPSPGKQTGCPETFASVSRGTSCAPTNLECDYPEGRCECTLGFGGPVQVDAGSGHWSCEAPSAGCPQPRPHAGSSCSAPSTLSCDYGTCTIQGGVTMQCVAGYWQEEISACPAQAGK